VIPLQQSWVPTERRDWLGTRHIAVLHHGNVDYIPQGPKLAAMALSCTREFPWLFDGVRQDVQELIRLASAHGRERQAKALTARSAGMGGQLRGNPIHSALVGGAGEGDRLWMRAALLRWSMGRVFELRILDDEFTRNRWCRFLWGDIQERAASPLDLWIQTLGARLARARLTGDVPTPGASGVASSQALQDNIIGVFGELARWASAEAEQETELSLQPLSSAAKNELPEGVPPEDCIEDERNAEVGDRSDGEDLLRGTLSADEEHAAIDSHILQLHGVLVPEDTWSLSAFEARQCLEMIHAQWLCPDPVSPALLLDATALCMSAVTGRHFRAARRGLLQWLYLNCADEPDMSSDFSIGSRSWLTTLPASSQFWSPFDERQRSLFEPCTEKMQLPLPSPLEIALSRLKDSRTALLESRFRPEPAGQITDSLSNVTARFSLARLRRTLAPRICAVSGALHDAQIIFGAPLGRSTAPLHYYSHQPTRLVEVYAAALRATFGDPWDPADLPLPRHYVGPTGARINEEFFRQCTHALAERTRQFVAGNSIWDSFNALSAYTALMFVGQSAHRQTYRLQDVTALSIERRRRMAVFGDKIADASQASRLVALSALAVDQIDAHLSFARYAVGKLRRHKANFAAAEQIEALLHGRLALFSLFDGKTGQLIPLCRSALSAFWPEITVPLPLLRARCATRLLDSSVPADFIYRQMGHALDSMPFTAEDPQNPQAWCDCVSVALEKIAHEDGWSLIEASCGRRDAAPAGQVRSASQIAMDEREFWSKESKRAATQIKRSRSKKLLAPAFEARFQSILSAIAPTHDSASPRPVAVKLDQPQLALLREGIQELAQTAAEARTLREMLISRLGRLKRECSWDIRYPLHRLYKVPPIPTRVTPACVQASAWIDVATAKLTEGWSGRLSAIDRGLTGAEAEIDWLARGTAMLILDGGVVIPERWRQVVEALDEAMAHPASPVAVLVQITTFIGALDSNSHQEASEADSASPAGFTLTGVSALFALRAAEVLKRRPELKKDLASTLAARIGVILGPLIGPQIDVLTSLCAVSRLGVRLRRSGLLCAYLDATTPGTDLPPAELIRLFRGEVRPNQRGAAGVRGMGAIPDSDVSGLGVEVAAFRGELKRLFAAAKKLPDVEANRSQLAHALQSLCTGHERSSWTSVCVDWLVGHLERERCISTGYLYLTYVVYPFTRAIRVLSEFTPTDEVMTDAQASILAGLKGAHRARVARLAQTFFELGSSRGWDDPEVDELECAPRRYTTRPYLLADYEFLAARELIADWISSSRHAHNRAVWEKSGLLVDLAHTGGFRTSEVGGCRVRDINVVGSATFVHVRWNRRRKLKTRASERFVRIDTALRLVNDACNGVTGSLAAIERAHRQHSGSEMQLFAELGVDPDAVVDFTSRVSGAALEARSPGAPRRLYSGRHSTGSYWVLRALAADSALLASPIFRLRREPAALCGIPHGLGLLQASRFLGHARRTTTLTHYFHFFGEVAINESDIALRSSHQEIGLIALAARLSSASLRNMLASEKVGVSGALMCAWTNRARKAQQASSGSTVWSSDAVPRPNFGLKMQGPVSRTTDELLLYLRSGPQALLDLLGGDSSLARTWLSALTTLSAAPRSLVNPDVLRRDADWLAAPRALPPIGGLAVETRPQHRAAIVMASGLDGLRRKDRLVFNRLLNLLERAVLMGSSVIPCESQEERSFCREHLSALAPKGFTVAWHENGPRIAHNLRGRTAAWLAVGGACIARSLGRLER
jgi:integrase